MDPTTQVIGATVALLVLKEVFAFVMPLFKEAGQSAYETQVLATLGGIKSEMEQLRECNRESRLSLHAIAVELAKLAGLR